MPAASPNAKSRSEPQGRTGTRRTFLEQRAGAREEVFVVLHHHHHDLPLGTQLAPRIHRMRDARTHPPPHQIANSLLTFVPHGGRQAPLRVGVPTTVALTGAAGLPFKGFLALPAAARG
jgi:hypothetical protein